jgi:secondary thiamine-phosphate synthase enzyme
MVSAKPRKSSTLSSTLPWLSKAKGELLVRTTEDYLDTKKGFEFIDITEIVRQRVAESKVRAGIAAIYSPHTTCSVRINEHESSLLNDFELFLERMAPKTSEYAHNRSTLDDRPNAHSHILSLLMNTSETVPIYDCALCLGTWQRVFFVELDGPRQRRRFLVHIVGD